MRNWLVAITIRISNAVFAVDTLRMVISLLLFETLSIQQYFLVWKVFVANGTWCHMVDIELVQFPLLCKTALMPGKFHTPLRNNNCRITCTWSKSGVPWYSSRLEGLHLSYSVYWCDTEEILAWYLWCLFMCWFQNRNHCIPIQTTLRSLPKEIWFYEMHLLERLRYLRRQCNLEW